MWERNAETLHFRKKGVGKTFTTGNLKSILLRINRQI